MRGLYLLSFAALWSLSTANPLRTMVVHDSIRAVPSGFASAGTVSPSQQLKLRIALTQSDIAGLEAKTLAVSDPASPLYGQHLTPEEVATYVSPAPETLSGVSSWLSENKIASKSISPAGDMLEISLSVQDANTLLAAQFESFTHIASGKNSIRTLSYSVPAALSSHIQFVHPTTSFTPPLAKTLTMTAVSSEQKRAAENTTCTTLFTPSCAQAAYSIPTTKATSPKNGIAVAGYANQYANSQDLSTFLTKMRPDLGNVSFAVDLIDGGANEQYLGEAGDEADLDVQYTVGIASGVPVTFISVGFDSTDGIDGFIDIVNYIMAMPAATRPTVLSSSYGFNENELSLSVATSVCNAYMQLGAIGVSTLFATGDGGVGGFSSGTTSCPAFVPTTPASCPFVTSVGGTQGLPPQTGAALSSGGFSNYFAVPSYQTTDAKSYASAMGSQFSGMYNKTGRGYPDVSAQASNVEIIWTGQLYTVGGTSCATPIFASVIALLNDRLLAAGKPVMGFLNPWLYSAAGRATLTDVTSGTNPGCNTAGFSATAGWDPVTGLGTPNFDKMLAALGL
ncbi:family S53 protease [Roridomyces roridus]|uniref:tripeptidyl-peptidase II n=1 Tax=Roridomyces roridus TaxID=1738132 RepID=A0AAD7BPB6_9AGAR|nr:family S53 protease [Roridomyces roridus]